MKTSDFYNILFEWDEHTCFTSRANGTTVYHYENPVREKTEYFSINAIDPLIDRAPEKSSQQFANASVPRRADANCISFRNFLIEMDNNTIQEQAAFLKQSNVPYSTIVHSGGKSLHCIISLSEPVTRELYDMYWLSIQKVFLNIGCIIDPSTKNPTRLSRCANSFRTDKKKVQELKRVWGRTTNEHFLYWLEQHKVNPEMFRKIEAIKAENIITNASDDLRYDTAKRRLTINFSDAKHPYLLKLIAQCNMCGVSEDSCKSLIENEFCKVYNDREVTKDEVSKMFSLIYGNGNFGIIEVLTDDEKKKKEEENQKLYDSLPNGIKKVPWGTPEDILKYKNKKANQLINKFKQT